jgi:hypothetical protein
MMPLADVRPPDSARAKPLEVDPLDHSSCRREVGRSILRVTRSLAAALARYATIRVGVDQATRDEAIAACDASLLEIDELASAVRSLRNAMRNGHAERLSNPGR